ncbi:PstS family phosphate ABC transporter substrate-binding protein [Planktothrix agardhii]|uniref:PstS family phosphate ABC transporter substrate-binding protein n=1 Tax=Planktothrix agardhii TaxID=1160 RepID=UPI0020A77761|nr:PstS family phosphate ABC transporter substrate-binding protein [Planktothrix agardhii]CAD5982186.1 Phosphate-binding protein PstS [Planktothrix agardhii]
MAQKNDTTTLILALLITGGLISGGIWWFTRNMNLSTFLNSNPSPSSSIPPKPTPIPPTYIPQTFAEVPNVPNGVFTYGGSTTFAPIRQVINPEIQKIFPQFQLRYFQNPSQSPGSGSGIKMLIDNQISFAESSRPLQESEYQQARQRGLNLIEVPIAIDGIVVAVNPNLNIQGLTINQLKQIYTGKITNWNQLGGENIPIVAYSRTKEAGGTTEFFIMNVLGGESFGEAVKFIPTTTEALRAISNNPGGIYYASAPEVVEQCTIKPIAIGLTSDALIQPYKNPLIPPENCPQQRNQIDLVVFTNGAYPLTRSLFIIVKQNNQIEQQAGEAYTQLLLTSQGQDLIEKLGFIRIR